MHLRRLTTIAAAVAAVLTTCSVASLGVAPAYAAGLTSHAYFNDPDAPNDNFIRYLFQDRFNQAPAGSTARVVMYNIDDENVVNAMINAFSRGVDVKVILANKNCDGDQASRLRGVLNRSSTDGSWMHCPVGSARSAGGVVHQKSVTFSQTGGTPYVTLVGSANMTEEAWRDQWTDMFQYADRKDVYDAYNDVFALQAAGDDMGSPYRTWTADDGVARANFFPVNDETPTSADDPVLTRLQNLPDNGNTTIVVANYSTHDARGTWLVNELIAKKRAGATVRFISGPPTSDALEDKMRAAGIPVTRAFDPDCASPDTHVAGTCNYIHLKGMVAKYWEDGQWNYRSYTGSDNWSDDALNNDDVTQRIGGEGTYDDYLAFFRTIEARY